jgi:hypothetical protein
MFIVSFVLRLRYCLLERCHNLGVLYYHKGDAFACVFTDPIPLAKMFGYIVQEATQNKDRFYFLQDEEFSNFCKEKIPQIGKHASLLLDIMSSMNVSLTNSTFSITKLDML